MLSGVASPACSVNPTVRIPFVRGSRLAWWSTGPGCGPTDDSSAPCWSVYAEDRLTGRRRRADTHLRHEPEPGRLHRRARRRHRLERAERRAVPVVVRPGGCDGPGVVRAQTVGDDELPLADRRPAAGRHTGGD